MQLAQAGRYGEAIQACNEAAKLEPGNVEILLLGGMLASQARQHECAVATRFHRPHFGHSIV